ncbi:MAG: sensor histidine kinase [Nitrospinae bacterium]|nr:sensor histidine kinase [Nitrospinota bacterium]
MKAGIEAQDDLDAAIAGLDALAEKAEESKDAIKRLHTAQAAALNMMEDAEEFRREAERANDSLTEQQNILSSLNETFVHLGPDYGRNVQLITQACGKTLGAVCALYNRLEGGLLCSIGQWRTPGGFNPVDKPEGHICHDLIRKGKGNGAYIIRNLPETGYYKTDPNVAAYGLKTYIGHAVNCGEQTVGSLCAVFQEDAQLGANEGMIMGMLAKALENEEERWQSYAKLKKTNKDLEATQNASLNIMSDLDRQRKELDKSLQEKEALIREVHHRVKNNMQIISSLLKLQSYSIEDPALKAIFKDCENRIKSMTKVHERLYRTEDLAHIDFGDYIKSLAVDIFHSFKANAARISLAVNAEGVAMPIDTAIPCGLIVNELITNAMKHAFPGDRKGELVIEMKKIEKLTIELIVRDNGVGIPDGLDWRTSKSLGLNLVNSLAGQIHANIDLNREGGTEWRIRFGVKSQE